MGRRRGGCSPTRCPFVEAHRYPEFLERVADARSQRTAPGRRHLPDEFELAAETFHRFAEDKIRPVAEHVHRTNADIPEDVISGLAEIGGFGLSVPEEYGGFAAGGEADYLGMVVATEELSWGSLGVGGSLITRPEILTRAIVAGGTEEQKQRWLPRIAAGELMVGVMVTEPDYGSDVAGITTMAAPGRGRLRVNGVKTWATFAGRANSSMLLARTDPDRSPDPPRAVDVRGREGRGARPLVRARPARRREARGPRHRHARLPRHALVRGVVLRLVRARREPNVLSAGHGECTRLYQNGKTDQPGRPTTGLCRLFHHRFPFAFCKSRHDRTASLAFDDKASG